MVILYVKAATYPLELLCDADIQAYFAEGESPS